MSTDVCVGQFMPVVGAEGIDIGTLTVHEVEGRPVLVTRTEGGVQVFDGICPHAGFQFIASALSAGGEIECPMHGARFDATTGELTCGPGKVPLRRFESRVVDDQIEVVVE